MMPVNAISMNDFIDRIEMYIPAHSMTNYPAIGDVEGKPFQCGCGNIHTMNFEEHLYIADGGMFKAVFLSPICEFLNCLKLKKFFSSEIETLYSTKFLKEEVRFGFKEYPDFYNSIPPNFVR